MGVRPTKINIRGVSLTVCFIATYFPYLPLEVVDEVMLQLNVRAYLLLFVDSSLSAYKKGTYLQLAILPMLREFVEIAQYSRGSATLAYLYRELCRASLNRAYYIARPLHFL